MALPRLTSACDRVGVRSGGEALPSSDAGGWGWVGLRLSAIAEGSISLGFL